MVDTGGAIQVGALSARGLNRGYGDHTERDVPLELSPFLVPGSYKAAKPVSLGHLSVISVVVSLEMRNVMSSGRGWHECWSWKATSSRPEAD